MTIRFRVWIAALVFAAMAAPLRAQTGGDAVVVPLTDPNRPALVKLNLIMGSVTIKGVERRDISVTVRGGNRPRPARTPEAGSLRRLTQPAGLEVTEERNEVRIEPGVPVANVAFEIQVPVRTNLKIDLVNGRGLSVEDVDGNIEIQSINSAIALQRVSGTVVANTVNGKIVATLARVDAQKPMAFTSMTGSVDVTFPPSLKAKLKLQSYRGDVFTDFDMDVRPQNVRQSQRPDSARRFEVSRTLVAEVNGGGPEIELRSFNGDVFVRKTP